MATKVRTTTVERNDDTEAETEDEALSLTPLFDRGRDKKSKSIATISVRRTDPDEGHLGYLPPEATEGDIKAKYGGGEFTLQGKNTSGQIVHTMQGFKIAGDPVFQSEIAEARWNRLNRLVGRAGQADAPGTIKEILTTIEERDEKRRTEERERREEERRDRLEREERARREQQAHEEKQAKDAAEREERRRKDDNDREERRRKEQREDEERRARLHREDIERMDKSNQAAIAQTQQFFQQLTTITKRDTGAADPIKLLTTGMDLALKLRASGEGGGGDPPDALTALLSRLPETLTELRSTAKEAYHELKGKPAATVAAAGDEDEVTITGATAKRLKHAIQIMEKAGRDPEKLIDGFASHVIRMAEGGAAAAPAQVAKRPRPPAPRAAAKPRARPAPAKASARRGGKVSPKKTTARASGAT